MDSITGHINNTSLLSTGTSAFLDELEQVLVCEREFLIASDGNSLESLLPRKNMMIQQLKDLLLSGYQPDEPTRERIRTILVHNQVNLKLFRSVIGLITGYKKILKDIPFDTGTYTNRGIIDRQEVSLQFNGSA